jgi:hypothetical protein
MRRPSRLRGEAAPGTLCDRLAIAFVSIVFTVFSGAQRAPCRQPRCNPQPSCSSPTHLRQGLPDVPGHTRPPRGPIAHLGERRLCTARPSHEPPLKTKETKRRRDRRSAALAATRTVPVDLGRMAAARSPRSPSWKRCAYKYQSLRLPGPSGMWSGVSGPVHGPSVPARGNRTGNRWTRFPLRLMQSAYAHQPASVLWSSAKGGSGVEAHMQPAE